MRSRGIGVLGLLVAMSGLLSLDVRAEEKVSLKAVMIYASNEPGKKDPRLSGVEPQLRKLFRFERYQQSGYGQSSVVLPGNANVTLGQGHKLDIKVSKTKEGKVRAEVRWTRNGEKLMSTAYVLNRKDSTLIGGPSHDKGKLIVLLSVL